MRAVFAGTPEFSVPSLEALINTPFIDLVGVYTQPDRPAGRGKKLQQSAVKIVAEKSGIPVFQPQSFKHPDAIQSLAELNPDLVVVTAYGLLLPQSVLDIPRLGCVNVHASLLPCWRGAAPIQRCIEAGDDESGISLMQVQLALDSGPLLAKSRIEISEFETGGTLHDKLSALGGEVLQQNLTGIRDQSLKLVDQGMDGVIYATKLEKSESNLDWRHSARTLERKVRAFNPWPITTTTLGKTTLRVLQTSCRAGEQSAQSGEVLRADRAGILIQTGQDALNLEILQKPGGKVLAAADFLNGMPLSPGIIFGSA